jgi:hypothetical protein
LRPAAIALLAVVVALAGCGGGGGTTGSEAPDGATGCNGSAALCGKRLDQVVFPGTHNSYAASAEPGWHFAGQRFPIPRQLEDGITALLLDVHYGVAEPDSDLVRTDFAAEGADANKVAAAIPDRERRVAERLAGPLGVGLPDAKPSLYLCHTLCELGAEPLGSELKAIASFLDAHPRIFLVLVVEDYVPAAAIAAAFREAGLTGRAVALARHAPLPTLGHLLGAGKQLAVFSEKAGGEPPWYMPAFSFIQDTPLGANRPDQLSCDRFRGDADSPLLMVNHWIPPFPPSPRLNALIGRAGFLRHRLRACMNERGFEGAILAVDFYERTAAVRVAEEFNDG